MMKQKIVYVVSGLVRSGTSMMMESLIAGGMKGAYQESNTKRDKIINGYIPNRNGYYELGYKARHKKNFPAMYEGQLVKLFLHKVDELRTMPKNVVFKTVMMRRDIHEVFESAKRVRIHMGNELDDDELMRLLTTALLDISFFKEHSITYDEVWYPEVLTNPLDIFNQLKYHDWPINAEKCAEIPDPIKKRY
jgi:hypothetical protein